MFQKSSSSLGEPPIPFQIGEAAQNCNIPFDIKILGLLDINKIFCPVIISFDGGLSQGNVSRGRFFNC